MYPDRKYMDKPLDDDLVFEPFVGEYDSSFPENPFSLPDNTSLISDNFVPFSENNIQLLDTTTSFPQNVANFSNTGLPISDNLYLNGFNNRASIGDTFNKINLSPMYWFNSLFHSPTEISKGYIPVPVQLFEDIDSDLDEKLSSDKINRIFNSIEENNSSIIKSLEAYKIPAPVSKMILKKVITLSLKYSSND